MPEVIGCLAFEVKEGGLISYGVDLIELERTFASLGADHPNSFANRSSSQLIASSFLLSITATNS